MVIWLLKWFNSQDEGLKPRAYHVNQAVLRGHIPILDWAAEMGVLPDSYIYSDLVRRPYSTEGMKMLDWLYDHRVPFDFRLADDALVSGIATTNLMDWLAVRGELPTKEAVASSIRDKRYMPIMYNGECRGNMYVKDWAKEKGLVE